MSTRKQCAKKEADWTRDDFAEFIEYNPATGKFFWTQKPAFGVHVGDEVGWSRPDGYRSVQFKGQAFLLHRIGWLLETGDWPAGDLDHINGARADNRFVNLRVASSRENSQNMKHHRSGVLPGCYYKIASGKWVSQIKLNGEVVYLGQYETEVRAHEVYMEVAQSCDPIKAAHKSRANYGVRKKEKKSA